MHAIDARSQDVTYEGPRGLVRLRDRHVRQRIYLAQADALEFNVIAEF